MSVFSDGPRVVLCGERSPTAHAVCVRLHPHEGDHDWESAIHVAQRRSWTFTPCSWAKRVPGA